MKTFYLRERRNLEALKAFLDANWEAMSKTKTPMQVECKPESKNRSQAQNRYYWNLLKQIESDAWIEGRQYSDECWHEYVKGRFIGYTDIPGGKKKPLSTTNLSTKEFADYVTRVEAWAAQELGIVFVEAA